MSECHVQPFIGRAEHELAIYYKKKGMGQLYVKHPESMVIWARVELGTGRLYIYYQKIIQLIVLR